MATGFALPYRPDGAGYVPWRAATVEIKIIFPNGPWCVVPVQADSVGVVGILAVHFIYDRRLTGSSRISIGGLLSILPFPMPLGILAIKDDWARQAHNTAGSGRSAGCTGMRSARAGPAAAASP